MELKDRFKQARLHSGISQQELAEQAHTSQVMISKIELGKTVQPRRMEVFAHLLNVPEEWLRFGLNPPEWISSDNSNPVTKEDDCNCVCVTQAKEVPIVSWVRAGEFCNSETQVSFDDFEMILCPEPSASERTFALRVVGDSMTNPYGRSYPEGTIIFVDPLKMAQPGSRVIARTHKGYTFKELVMNEFGEQYLKPLNPSHQPLLGDDIEVCGVVIGSYFRE
ncbi:TPA: helix-turn-helix domain-containing protein [Photobacterium damselae]|uniref:helix-turn-helix domain-containing protein n=1 Tax=Gammaproteobacteria TaxID=1236 RepID=UPI0010FE6F74|nr:MULTISPECIES: XRE family transcriptional regulator [Gammaproteobacteria]MCG3811152.1 helix-turn-helix domain-containing protein [Photobacterium damselae]MCG3880491.1 helix-turn-helix domain-containing protein [Psychrobacter sp. Ps6]NVH51907.1 helix-turn-helix domain-containing protein [Photobacterium damselae subsp. damselae]NVO82703.1 helix-turn-helix domain-containing protein [Photobacterium damselae subsp. damselae]TLS83831.1 helix-turn-helix domain-containing protein [Photobacterium dam